MKTKKGYIFIFRIDLCQVFCFKISNCDDGCQQCVSGLMSAAFWLYLILPAAFGNIKPN